MRVAPPWAQKASFLRQFYSWHGRTSGFLIYLCMDTALGWRDRKLLSYLQNFSCSQQGVDDSREAYQRQDYLFTYQMLRFFLRDWCKNLMKASQILWVERRYTQNGEKNRLKYEELVIRQGLRNQYFGREGMGRNEKDVLIKRHFLEEDAYGAIWEIK